MKELSIEQKAKRYDEALEKSKRLYEQGTITESLSYVFPELRESEDERVRKDIITYLSTVEDKELIPYESWIAWLEKQGEQKVSEYDVVKTIKERIIEHFDNHLIIDKCFSIGGLKYDILKIINEVKFAKQGGQNPAWSKEDEEIIHCLEYTVRHFYEDEDTINRCCGWLKSLIPQNRWKPSDEQMKALGVATNISNIPEKEYQELEKLYQDLKKLK